VKANPPISPAGAGTWLLRAALLAAAAALLLPPVRSLFFAAGARWAYVLALSFTIAALAAPLLRAVAWRVGALDRPDGDAGRKIHDRPTALFGGLAVWVGVVGALLANGVWPQGLAPVLATATLLMAFSAADDLRPIGSSLKLTVFLVCSVLAVAAGARATTFDQSPLGTVLNLVLSVVWIIGIFNSLNFLDGMDGLATGLSVIIAGFLGVVAFETAQPALGWAAAAIAGACLGFIPYNFRPGKRATMFLGDAGSNFLGFMLASLALLGYWADADPLVAISSPILIFSVLIYDMTYITLDRIASGKVRSFYEWIDYVGQDHLHHRVAAVLGGRAKAVVFILMMSATLGIAALGLRNAAAGAAALLLLQAFLVLSLITMLERRGKGLLRGFFHAPPPAGSNPGRPPVLVVDFDNTIASPYGYPEIGKPIEGSRRFLRLLKNEGWKIIIYSCRSGAEHEAVMAKWLEENEIPFDEINRNSSYPWASGKPVGDVYLDDRGVRFEGRWDAAYQKVQELLHLEGPNLIGERTRR
jgi:UDP-GlcNAc:undecaprenyl-phosphate GlcNAc-1-phosphate transferase